jgi:protein subunit release factor A
MAYTQKEFEAIVSKAQKLSQNQSKIEGAMEAIQSDWLKNYETDDIGELESKLAELQEDLAADEADRDKVFEELKGLHQWQFV